MKILVTGGAGFIGSAVVRHLIENTEHSVVNVDKLTYAADLTSLKPVEGSNRYAFEKADIGDSARMDAIFSGHQPDAVMHLAAESHVDRSIDGPDTFMQTNILGTYWLLQSALGYWRSQADDFRKRFRFHQVSTDEVFGALTSSCAPFTEETPYAPHSPYSASKAASDHLARAWGHTYGLPVVVTNCTNNYGPYHFPEKLIPLTIIKALEGEAIPVYGRGDNIRDWLYVDDHAEALTTVIERGMPDETYGIGGDAEKTNLAVVETICDLVDEMAAPLANGLSRRSLIGFVSDRPGHDFRYAMNFRKIQTELGWKPREDFESGLRKTVRWFLDNSAWWEPLRARYQGERIGTGKPRSAP